MTLRDKLFSFKGRFSRSEFWAVYLSVSFANLFVFILLSEPLYLKRGWGVVLLIAIVPLIWITYAAIVKRLHDRDKGAAWIALTFIPYVNIIWGIVELGCLPGTQGPNRFDIGDARVPDIRNPPDALKWPGAAVISASPAGSPERTFPPATVSKPGSSGRNEPEPRPGHSGTAEAEPEIRDAIDPDDEHAGDPVQDDYCIANYGPDRNRTAPARPAKGSAAMDGAGTAQSLQAGLNPSVPPPAPATAPTGQKELKPLSETDFIYSKESNQGRTVLRPFGKETIAAFDRLVRAGHPAGDVQARLIADLRQKLSFVGEEGFDRLTAFLAVLHSRSADAAAEITDAMISLGHSFDFAIARERIEGHFQAALGQDTWEGWDGIAAAAESEAALTWAAEEADNAALESAIAAGDSTEIASKLPDADVTRATLPEEKTGADTLAETTPDNEASGNEALGNEAPGNESLGNDYTYFDPPPVALSTDRIREEFDALIERIRKAGRYNLTILSEPDALGHIHVQAETRGSGQKFRIANLGDLEELALEQN